MTITIKKILGESFDLDTKEELPKALLLSNGQAEAVVYVDDACIEQVLLLMAGVTPTVASTAPVRASVSAESINQPVQQSVRRRSPQPRKITQSEIDEIAASEAFQKFDGALEGFDPGEVYADPDTGASSL